MGIIPVILETDGTYFVRRNFSAQNFMVICFYVRYSSVFKTSPAGDADSEGSHARWQGTFSLLLSAILISVNWYVYIWAVNHHLMLEASLGYYINPLVSVLLGIIFLKERLNKLQTIAILIAAAGVILSTIQYGSFPVVAILLAFSFGFYGLIKKRMSFTSAIGLTIETLLLAPAALVYLLFFLKEPVVTMNPNSFGSLGLLFFAGVFTAVPLLLFSEGAKRIPLYQVGILQYIAPTITLFLGLFVYHEHLSSAKIVTFLCIWVAILLFTTSQLRMKKTANSH